MTNTRNNTKNRSDSTASRSSNETIRAVDNQETEDSSLGIEPKTRSYIDSAIQAATTSIMQQMQQMQQFMTQQAETQREWNAQILETINQKLAHKDQPNINDNGQSPNKAQPDDNQQRATSSRTNNGSTQGNYPPTPVINSLLLASSMEDQGIEPADNSEAIFYATTSRKFPSFVYMFKDNKLSIQGFLNQKAIETERIRLWWP
ncbi:hypothetical protein F8M41_026226 [Gigaspora margarita]|uniref:Uncharacterized protein n=1 Tax=Gigaspora margarita TaxID=4874 RepID=A0A8H3XJ45_GIGMA|nr:hypothetical protein F8M41_026226 [Gigaspora margarita]